MVCPNWPALLRGSGGGLVGGEVDAIGVVENQRAHARLGLHHHALGEVYADVLRPQQVPEALLIVEIGARRIAEAITLAVILRGEAVVHGRGGRIGEAPVLADAAVQPLRGAFGGFNRQRLDGVRFQELACLFPLFGALSDALARRHHEQRHVIAAPFVGLQDIVAETQSIGPPLPAKMERVQRRLVPRREQVNRVAVALGLEELPHRLHFQKAGHFLLQPFHLME